MYQYLRAFWRSQSGATTVDFVVATAAGIALALSVMAFVSGGSTQISENVSDELEDMEVVSEL